LRRRASRPQLKRDPLGGVLCESCAPQCVPSFQQDLPQYGAAALHRPLVAATLGEWANGAFMPRRPARVSRPRSSSPTAPLLNLSARCSCRRGGESRLTIPLTACQFAVIPSAFGLPRPPFWWRGPAPRHARSWCASRRPGPRSRAAA